MAFLADTLVTSNWRNDHVGYMLLRVSGKTTRIPINIPNHPGFASGLVSIWYVLLKQGNERFCWKRLVLAKRCTHRVLHLHGGLKLTNSTRSHWDGMHPASSCEPEVAIDDKGTKKGSWQQWPPFSSLTIFLDLYKDEAEENSHGHQCAHLCRAVNKFSIQNESSGATAFPVGRHLEKIRDKPGRGLLPYTVSA